MRFEVDRRHSRPDRVCCYIPDLVLLQVVIEETIDPGAIEVVGRDGVGGGYEQIAV